MRYMKSGNIPLAFGVFVVWLAAAYLLNDLLIGLLIFAFMGGFAEPPAPWLAVHWFGMKVLPALFLFGGLPSAIQAVRGRNVKLTLWISIAAFALAWLLVMTTIFWLPGVLGWYW